MFICTEITEELYRILECKGKLETSVHSAYRHVVNLEWEGRLLTCGDYSVGLVPYGLAVSESFPPGHYLPGQVVRISTHLSPVPPDILVQAPIITNLVLGTGKLPHGNLLPQMTSFCRDNPREGGIGEALCQIIPHLGTPPIQSFYHGPVLDRLANFLKQLREGQCGPNILGLGVGLTPSADDFVLGLLSLFRFVGDRRCALLKSYVGRHLQSTTPVSRNMLQNAVEDLYPAYIIHFYNTLTGSGDIPEALQGFSRHGHSSGMDTLYGILIALRLCRPGTDAVSTEESL